MSEAMSVTNDTGMEGEQVGVVRVLEQSRMVNDVLKNVMKNGVHYGIIPNCGNKPSLLKAGAEKILSTFRIAVDPVIEDLSTSKEVKYRVRARGLTHNGNFIGAGVGECSSEETKYKWKGANDKEYDNTDESQRRIKYGYENKETKQIATNPADQANTVLKMAKKRALVDLALTATSASDIFTQDVEDMDIATKKTKPATSKPTATEGKPQPKDPASLISEPQRKLLFAKCKNANIEQDLFKQYLEDEYGVSSTTEVKKGQMDNILNWISEQ